MPSDNYFKFDNIGDFVEGVVVRLDRATFQDDETPTPKLIIDAGGEEPVEVTCGARNLKSQILTLQPLVGDRVMIRFSGKNGRTKMFEVKVTKPNSNASSPVD